MNLRYLSILQSTSWCFEDRKKALVSALEKNVLKDLNRAKLNNLVKGWLHRIRAIKLRNVKDVRRWSQDMKIASTAYIVVLGSVHLASGIQNTLIWMNLKLLWTSDHKNNQIISQIKPNSHDILEFLKCKYKVEYHNE